MTAPVFTHDDGDEPGTRPHPGLARSRAVPHFRPAARSHIDTSGLEDNRTVGDGFRLDEDRPYRFDATVAALFDERKPEAGRPSEMSSACVAALIEAFETGATVEEAADYAGISRRTLLRWRQRGAKSRSHDEYWHIWRLTEAAKSRGKRILERCVMRAGATDPKIALRVLERRWPAEWRLRMEVEDVTDANRVERAREVLASRLDAIERNMRASTRIASLPESPAARAERESEEDTL